MKFEFCENKSIKMSNVDLINDISPSGVSIYCRVIFNNVSDITNVIMNRIRMIHIKEGYFIISGFDVFITDDNDVNKIKNDVLRVLHE